MIGGARPRSSCSTDERPQRLQSHRGHIADLGNPEQKLIELNLLGRDQVDLKPGAQPRGQIVRQIAREQVVEHADGAQLIGGDLSRRGEVIGHDLGPHLGPARPPAPWLRAASKSASISSCLSVFSANVIRALREPTSCVPAACATRPFYDAACRPGRCSAARRCTTADACTCETRDSTTPSARPISRMVISS